MSSTDLKPESKPVSRGVLHFFMKKGGCEESYTACVDCDEQKNTCKEAHSMLNKCMNDRSDYFQTYLELEKTTKERLERETVALVLPAKPKDKDEQLLTNFMTKNASCKEAFMALSYFCKEAYKNNQSCVHTPVMDTMLKCVKAHPEDYQPLLTVFETAKEHYMREIKAFEEQAERDTKGLI